MSLSARCFAQNNFQPLFPGRQQVRTPTPNCIAYPKPDLLQLHHLQKQLDESTQQLYEKDCELYGLRHSLDSTQEELEQSQEKVKENREKLERLIQEYASYKKYTEEQFQKYLVKIQELTTEKSNLEEKVAKAEAAAANPYFVLPDCRNFTTDRAQRMSTTAAPSADHQTQILRLTRELQAKDEAIKKLILPSENDNMQFPNIYGLLRYFPWTRDESTSTFENTLAVKEYLIRELEANMNYAYSQLKQMETVWGKRQLLVCQPSPSTTQMSTSLDMLKDQISTIRVEMERRKRRYSKLVDEVQHKIPAKTSEKDKLEDLERNSMELVKSFSTMVQGEQDEQTRALAEKVFIASRKCKRFYEEQMRLQFHVNVLSEMITVLNSEKIASASEYKRQLRLIFAAMNETERQSFNEMLNSDQTKIQELYDKLDLSEHIIRTLSVEVELWRSQYTQAMHLAVMARNDTISIPDDRKTPGMEVPDCSHSATTAHSMTTTTGDADKWHLQCIMHMQVLQETVGRQKIELQNYVASYRLKEAAVIGAECARDYFRQVAEDHGAVLNEPPVSSKKRWIPETPILDHVMNGEYCYRKNRSLPSLSPPVAELFSKAKAEWQGFLCRKDMAKLPFRTWLSCSIDTSDTESESLDLESMQDNTSYQSPPLQSTIQGGLLPTPQAIGQQLPSNPTVMKMLKPLPVKFFFPHNPQPLSATAHEYKSRIQPFSQVSQNIAVKVVLSNIATSVKDTNERVKDTNEFVKADAKEHLKSEGKLEEKSAADTQIDIVPEKKSSNMSVDQENETEAETEELNEDDTTTWKKQHDKKRQSRKEKSKNDKNATESSHTEEKGIDASSSPEKHSNGSHGGHKDGGQGRKGKSRNKGHSKNRGQKKASKHHRRSKGHK